MRFEKRMLAQSPEQPKRPIRRIKLEMRQVAGRIALRKQHAPVLQQKDRAIIPRRQCSCRLREPPPNFGAAIPREHPGLSIVDWSQKIVHVKSAELDQRNRRQSVTRLDSG